MLSTLLSVQQLRSNVLHVVNAFNYFTIVGYVILVLLRILNFVMFKVDNITQDELITV